MAYKPRTLEEINRQINGFKKMKETLPEFSMFGDKNWEKIDAQLDVLEDKEEADKFYIDETADEFEEGDNDIYFAAQEADDWLNSQHNEDLFESED